MNEKKNQQAQGSRSAKNTSPLLESQVAIPVLLQDVLVVDKCGYFNVGVLVQLASVTNALG